MDIKLFATQKRKDRLNFTDFDGIIKKYPDKPWIYWGLDNLVPEKLVYLYENSPTNKSIIDKKTDYTTGGALLNTPDELETEDIDYGKGFYNFLYKLTRDYFLYGGFCIQVVFYKHQRRIKKLIYQDFASVRNGFSRTKNEEGLYDQGVWISDDWPGVSGFLEQTYRAEHQPEFYRKFNPKMLTGEMEIPDQPVFLYFFENAPAREWYPQPDYNAGLSAIFSEIEAQNYIRNSYENGFNPGGILRLPDQPTPEQKEEILKDAELNMKGTENTSRTFIVWGSPDEVIEYTPFQNTMDHSGVLELQDRNQRYIITAHKLTSPVLVGLPSGPSLGGDGTTIEAAAREFFQQTIRPARTKIFTQIQKLLKGMGIVYEIEVEESYEYIKIEQPNNDA